MASKVPLEIGTRGTIGSLLKREIEYFKSLEVERVESFGGFERKSGETGPSRRNSWPGFKFSMLPWRRKKRRNSGICSMVEVAESQRLNEIPGFGYLNLRADSMRFDD